MSDVTVRKRDSGKWQYRVEIASVGGKRRQRCKGGFQTKSEALKAGHDFLIAYEHGNDYIPPCELSVHDLFYQWLEEYSKTDLNNKTTESYEKKIRLYILPSIGDYKVKSITRRMLQVLLNDLSDTGLSHNTISTIRGILTGCFDYAEMNRLITQTPAYRLKLPKNTAVKQRTAKHVYIPKDKIDMIFQRFPVNTTAYLPMQIAYHCGLRLGEVFGLTWDDVDLDKKYLSVHRQVQWFQDRNRSKDDISAANGTKKSGNGFWYFSPPKYDSYRTIELDDEIVDILKTEYEKQQRARDYYKEYYLHYYAKEPLNHENNPDFDTRINPIGTEPTDHEADFIMRQESGYYCTPRIMAYASRIIHKKLNYPEFDFHSFRHTHATMLREKHAPDVYIQERLGHVNLATTNKYMNHLTADTVDQGIDVLNSLYHTP